MKITKETTIELTGEEVEEAIELYLRGKDMLSDKTMTIRWDCDFSPSCEIYLRDKNNNP